jgi:septal ring factor EnvC (AmiA/AmiB activator)
MKNFIVKNFVVLVLALSVLSFLKGCSDGRELTKVRKEIEAIKNETYTKSEMDARLQLEGLKAEKRMIQSTDRKLLDVNRQVELDKEIKLLEAKLSK